MENEKVICGANIIAKLSKVGKILLTALIVITITLTVGMYVYAEGGEDGLLAAVVILVLCMMLVVPILISIAIRKYHTKKCYMKLTENGVVGQGLRQIVGRSQQHYIVELVRLPIDKIDSIGVHKTLLWDGKVVTVRSASDGIRFPCVHNADEFVNATLAKIEEFKQNVMIDSKNIAANLNQNSSSNTSVSSVSKIKELKELLDDGLITQEEFDAKRKELLDKI